MQTAGIPYTEALTGRAGEVYGDRVRFHTGVAMKLGNLAREARADRSVAIGHRIRERAAARRFDRGQHVRHHQSGFLRGIEGIVACHLTELRLIGSLFVNPKDGVQIEALLFSCLSRQTFEQVDSADQLFEAPHPQLGQPLAGFRCHESEEVHHALDVPDKVRLTELGILGCDTGRTVVEMANAQVLATHSDHGRGTKTETLGAQNGRLDHIKAGLHTPVGLHPHLAAQTVAAERLMHFCYA